MKVSFNHLPTLFLALLLVSLAACSLIPEQQAAEAPGPAEVEPDAPEPETVLLNYNRSGGIAGLDERLTITEAGEAILVRHDERYEIELDPEILIQLRESLDAIPFSALEDAYLPQEQGADLIEYTLTYQNKTVHTADTAVPESLAAVLDSLNNVILLFDEGDLSRQKLDSRAQDWS